ncbi:MAG: DUF721 domain-containing protein [Paludibacteraceae bacterium]|nr:DUF721 domain-containing protein [Paludibacteraceae bacterium]
MRRQDTQTITDLISEYLKDNNLEQGYLEQQILASWDTTLGPLIARYTGEKEIRGGVLYVHIKSAPLRQELFGCRYQLVEKLNAAVGATGVIKDIRLLA